MKHFLIFVPGLGDAKTGTQQWAVKLWRIYGVKAETFPLRWATGRDFEKKLAKLLARIDKLTADGYAVSLVGASAGGTAVINAFAERPDLHSVVGICGVMNPEAEVNPKYYRENPAFKGAMGMLAKSLDKLNPEERHRIMSVHPLWDNVVYPRNTVVRGALRKRVVSAGHALTIGLMITLRAYTIVRFVKYKAKQYA